MENIPEFKKKAFICPFCHTFAHMKWYHPEGAVSSECTVIVKANCSCCNNSSYWISSKNKAFIVYPKPNFAPPPNPDMPESIMQDYKEASIIVDISPRASAALLRLAIQKLCIELGESGHNLNSDIASLVTKGLPIKIQKALDTVRVIGNYSVHPGILDDKDISEDSYTLFVLINLIIDYQISKPKEIDRVFNKLPEGDRKSIEKRDNGS